MLQTRNIVEILNLRTSKKMTFDLHLRTLNLKPGSWKWGMTHRLVMIYMSMKFHEIIPICYKVMLQTMKCYVRTVTLNASDHFVAGHNNNYEYMDFVRAIWQFMDQPTSITSRKRVHKLHYVVQLKLRFITFSKKIVKYCQQYMSRTGL